jgi:hypothetical protein
MVLLHLVDFIGDMEILKSERIYKNTYFPKAFIL